MKLIKPLSILILLAGNLCLICAQAHQNLVVIPLEGESSSKLNNVVRVDLEGGEFRRIEDALDSITDASESNPYLVYIAPGDYRLRRTLKLKPFVSVVGSGITLTRIVGRLIATASDTSDCPGIVAVEGGGRGSKLSNVSIIHTGSANEVRTGICAGEVNSATLESVELVVRDADTNYGLFARGRASFKNSYIRVAGRFSGLDNFAVNAVNGMSDVLIENSYVAAGAGTAPTGSTYTLRALTNAPELDAVITLKNTIVAGANALLMSGVDPVVNINNSEIIGAIDSTEGSTINASYSSFNQPINGSALKTCVYSNQGDQLLNNNCTIEAEE